MSTGQIWQTTTDNLKATLSLASHLGQRIKGREVIELRGDLGSGKTTFVKGLVSGMGSPDAVSSPSFTLSNQYKTAKGLTVHHFDFYRLTDPGILREQLAEAVEDPAMVTVVEWGEIVEDTLPEDHLTISIEATSEQSRKFTFIYLPKLKYLLPRKNT